MKRAILIPILSFLALACQRPPVEEWMIYRVEAGQHDFKPSPLLTGKLDPIVDLWRFLPSMQYDLGDGDQCDWNKLVGVAWGLSNHRNSMMIAWRWNSEGYWQVAPYYHDEGNTRWARANCGAVVDYSGSREVDPTLPHTRIYPGETFRTSITPMSNGWVEVEVQAPAGSFSHRHFFGVEADNTYRQIGPWFGGNNPAPHDMKLERKALQH